MSKSNDNCGVVWHNLGNGKQVSGLYEVKNGLMTVTIDGRSKRTQLGGTPKEVLAKMLLRDLIAEAPRNAS